MGQIKSSGGFSTTTAVIAATAMAATAAGFKSISSTESSSKSTIGDSIPRAAEREGRRFSGDKFSMLPLLAAMRLLFGLGFLLLVVVVVVTTVVVTTGIPPLPLLLIALSLTLNNDAKRVELRWGANSSAIRAAAFRAAVRVERLVGTEGLGTIVRRQQGCKGDVLKRAREILFCWCVFFL